MDSASYFLRADDAKGFTPVRALGAIDQHSQIQLYTSGPDDKFYTVLTVDQGKGDIALPAASERSFDKLSVHMNSPRVTASASSTCRSVTPAGSKRDASNPQPPYCAQRA